MNEAEEGWKWMKEGSVRKEDGEGRGESACEKERV
jgi:hypothetical protein